MKVRWNNCYNKSKKLCKTEVEVKIIYKYKAISNHKLHLIGVIQAKDNNQTMELLHLITSKSNLKIKSILSNSKKQPKKRICQKK